MPKVIIDGTEYEVKPGRNMLEAALDNGLDLPYFCWHPAMGSIGACRLCAVRVYKDADDTRGKIQMACMTPALDGTRMSINDPGAIEFRRYVIEWLMTNHPHDCPVCDEGGECHLQDMTAMCGQVYRRFEFKKRTYRNQYLGPFVNHEMNRCIQCYRCVRFYRDHAGGTDLDVFASKNHLYFGREEDGVLESEFSGNLVEVCPTGVFTDKTYQRHYTRKWDLETAPSVCIHCGLGCNTIPGARQGMVRRIHARYNSDVNGYFLCDRGRFGYEFADLGFGISDLRFASAAQALSQARGLIGIGSPRASLESNYALRKLVGADSFSTGLSEFDQRGAELALGIMRAVRTPSLAEVGQADAVLILGADPTNEAPMLDFAIRQAMRKAPLDAARKLSIPDWDATCVANVLQGAKGELVTVTSWPIKLEEIAANALHLTPPDIAAFADIDFLKQAHKPVIVTSISAGWEIVTAAAHIAESVGSNARLSIIVPEANTMGVAMMGGMHVEAALAKIESGEADTLVVLENDLMRRAHPALLERALAKVKYLIVLDCVRTDISERATAALPIATYYESDGTFVSSECRAQRFFQVFASERQPAWRVLREMAGEDGWPGYEDVLRELAEEMPVFAPALDAGPPADWRSPAGQKVPRMPHRYSGRTAISANVSVNEKRPKPDPETPFAFTMEGDQNVVPGPLADRYWYPGWNSVAALNKFQIEVGGELHGGNPGVRLVEPGEEKQILRSAQDDMNAQHDMSAQDDMSAQHHISAQDDIGAQDGTSVGVSGVQSRNEPSAQLWLVPKPCIFGSEELSRLAEGIAEVIPPAELTVHPETACGMGMEATDVSGFGADVSPQGSAEPKSRNTIHLDVDGVAISLPVRCDESMPIGVLRVPAGFPETKGILAPTDRVTVRGK